MQCGETAGSDGGARGGGIGRRDFWFALPAVGLVWTVACVFLLRPFRYHNCDEALREVCDVGHVDAALALERSKAPAGDEPRQPAVGWAVGGKQDEGRAVEGRDFGADDQLEGPVGVCGVVFPGGDVGPDGAGERVAIGDGEGFVAQGGGLVDELFRMRRSAQEGEVGQAIELGVANGGGGAGSGKRGSGSGERGLAFPVHFLLAVTCFLFPIGHTNTPCSRQELSFFSLLPVP